MFGKGIVSTFMRVETDCLLQYLANMASKSAGYCRSESSNGEGLLLLCEAQLGNPMYQCEHSDPDAARNCEKNVSTPRIYANDAGQHRYSRYWVCQFVCLC